MNSRAILKRLMVVQLSFGLYWHSEHFAAGYGLKAAKNIYLIKDVPGLDSTGFAHYFDVTYKF